MELWPAFGRKTRRRNRIVAIVGAFAGASGETSGSDGVERTCGLADFQKPEDSRRRNEGSSDPTLSTGARKTRKNESERESVLVEMREREFPRCTDFYSFGGKAAIIRELEAPTPLLRKLAFFLYWSTYFRPDGERDGHV